MLSSKKLARRKSTLSKSSASSPALVWLTPRTWPKPPVPRSSPRLAKKPLKTRNPNWKAPAQLLNLPSFKPDVLDEKTLTRSERFFISAYIQLHPTKVFWIFISDIFPKLSSRAHRRWTWGSQYRKLIYHIHYTFT